MAKTPPILGLLAALTLSSLTYAQSAPGERYLASVPGMAEYRIRKYETDSLGMTHTWADQYYAGLPVYGGEAIVHVNRDGSLDSIDEEAFVGMKAPTSARTSAQEAVGIAETFTRFTYGTVSRDPSIVKLYAVRYSERDRLAYQVQVGTVVYNDDEVLPVVWVDAVTGEVFWTINNSQHEVAQGPTLYAGVQFFPVTLFNGKYFMEDRNRKMQLFTGNNTNNNEYRVYDLDLVFDSSVFVGPNDAWLNMLYTYEYFSQKHGWVGMDNDKGPRTEDMTNFQKGFTCVCDFGTSNRPKNSANAHWNGLKKKAYFGGMDGTIGFGELVSCDVVGHELTHAVNQYTANMVYSDQSGAVNESMSDVFGSMIERFRDGAINDGTFLIAEDLFVGYSTGEAFRDMIDPAHFNQPDHMSEYDFAFFNDSGNVHKNSGIPNRAFTLVALGGTHTNSPTNPMAGIGADKAEKIWFRALRYHMGTFTSFSRARRTTEKAARELYGSNSTEVHVVSTAWEKCGVD